MDGSPMHDGPIALRAIEPTSPELLTAEIPNGKPRLAMTVACVTVLAGAVILGTFGWSYSEWNDLALLFALVWISQLCCLSAIETRPTWVVDPRDAPTIVALGLLGPIPALLTVAVDIAQWVLERYRLIALASNLAGQVWSIVVAFGVMQALGIQHLNSSSSLFDYAGVALAGSLMAPVDLVIGRLISGVADGYSVLDFARQELLAPLPVFVGSTIFGVGAAFVFVQAGLIPMVLVLLGGLLVWRLVGPRLLKRFAMGPQRIGASLSDYAYGIAVALNLGADSKQVLLAGAAQVSGIPSASSPDSFQATMDVVLFSTQRWDGKEGLAGRQSGESIPIEGRVLKTAVAWHSIVDRGASDEHAILDLRSRAGTELDPRVVEAASRALHNGFVARDPLLRFGDGMALAGSTN